MESNGLKDFINGIKGGIPIAAGYFSVSFSFGILCAAGGISPLTAALISLVNVTSAGQFAGLSIILSGGTLVEMILSQLVINSRYSLMSLALSQKLSPEIGTLRRMLVAFANTDEIFAVAIGQEGKVGFMYMMGLESTPIFGWTLGTLVGALAGNILPDNIRMALGIALYAMFIAIVVPVMSRERNVLAVVLLSAIFSIAMTYAPMLKEISSGFAIIICTVGAACTGALLFPVSEEESE